MGETATRRLLLIVALASLLAVPSVCNDRGVERLEEYGERYDVEIPVFDSSVCGNGVCVR